MVSYLIASTNLLIKLRLLLISKIIIIGMNHHWHEIVLGFND